MLVIQDAQLAHDLARVAQQEDLAVEELLKSMLAQYTAQKPAVSADEPGTVAWIAAHLDEVAVRGAKSTLDPAEADEILRTEFADYLFNRMNGD